MWARVHYRRVRVLSTQYLALRLGANLAERSKTLVYHVKMLYDDMVSGHWSGNLAGCMCSGNGQATAGLLATVCVVLIMLEELFKMLTGSFA